MKAFYRIPIKAGGGVPVTTKIAPVQIGNAKIDWGMDGNNKLSSIGLTISEAELRRDSAGVIHATYPELEEAAFKAATYIANSILVHTGADAIDPEIVLLKTPELFPETPEEETLFASSPKRLDIAVRAIALCWGILSPNEWVPEFEQSAALASFADGIRVSSPFLRYEQFYKVIEHFFSDKGEGLDEAVSNHASSHDPRFTKKMIEQLRRLRNRCVHPQAPHGHVNPESRASLSEVKYFLTHLEPLARLLLRFPPR